MKIEQITKSEHVSRIDPWYQKAVNDPSVFPFLSGSVWRSAPEPATSDWDKAYYMDSYDVGLLSVTFDHMRRVASIGLWALGGNTGVAAFLMRFAICRVPQLYGVSHLSFCIAEHNRAWAESAMRVAGKWMWGREPACMFDPKSGTWKDGLNFKVPLSAIRERRNLFVERRKATMTEAA